MHLSQVIFSDEKIFRVRPGGHVRCWVPNGESKFKARYSIPSVQKPESILIWAAMRGDGRLCVRRCPCTLTAESYQAILQSALQFLRRRHATGQCPIASKSRYFPCSHPPCQFQQDGAPAHCAKSTRLWMQKKKVVQFNAGVWPPVSPDLSPIEHVWPIALRHLNRAVFSGKDQLWSALQQAFAQITPAEIAALYQSMPQRLAAVVAAGGGPTRY